MLRVIAGTLGGRRLRVSPGRVTRPTSDRVREAIFARLESRYGLRDARVLDLFAGSGAMAIEALSRGARRAVCVESDRRAAAVLQKNVESVELEASIEVVRADFRAALDGFTTDGRVFDGMFLDPPYGVGLGGEALGLAAGAGVLAPGAWIVLETGHDEPVPPTGDGLIAVRDDRYGDTKVSLFETEAK